MITAPTYQGQSIGVFGLARSGLATVHSLVASGATVFAWDDNIEAREKVSACAEDLYALDFGTLDALVLAPGVPLTHPAPHPLVLKAKAANVPIISDLDVFEAARTTLPSHELVGITGTNGKSTTTALVGHILAEAGRPVAIGGNIGTGVLALDPLPEGGVYVLELSSFQLDLCQNLACDVGILLNITPDHLDRHGSMDAYLAAKQRLFTLQRQNAVPVIGIDDDYCRRVAAHYPSVVPVSVKSQVSGGVSAENGVLAYESGGETHTVDIQGLASLKGQHNWQNAAAAFAACRALGVEPTTIVKGLESFPGLAHRQEPVPSRPGITVVNDSKATNVDAAFRALNTFDNIRWVAGGRSKDKDFCGLSGALASVRKAYLMGEDAEAIAAILPKAMPRVLHPTMLEAVSQALDDAEIGDTVLLSPACTAFDQYRDFEHRGDVFKAAVAAYGEHS